MTAGPDDPVWIDGNLVDAAHSAVPISDRSYLTGHGVFEAVEVIDGKPFALDEHLDRLERSARTVGLGVPSRALIRRAIDEVWSHLEQSDPVAHRHAVARVTLSDDGAGRAPRLVVTWREWPDRSLPAVVTTSRWRRNERGALTGVKSTSYGDNVVMLEAARSIGADEAMVLNSRDELCEGTSSNVFVVIDDELVTPPEASGLLAGVTRALLLGAGIGEERTVADSDLERITEAFLTSTTRHVQPIARWDDRPLVVDGDHTSAARRAWIDIRQRT